MNKLNIIFNKRMKELYEDYSRKLFIEDSEIEIKKRVSVNENNNVKKVDVNSIKDGDSIFVNTSLIEDTQLRNKVTSIINNAKGRPLYVLSENKDEVEVCSPNNILKSYIIEKKCIKSIVESVEIEDIIGE